MTNEKGPRPRRTRLVSSDMDHARAEISRLFAYGGLRLDTTGGAAFRIDLDVVALGPVVLTNGSFGSPMTHTVTGGGGYQVVLADGGRARVLHGRDDIGVDHTRGGPAQRRRSDLPA